MKDLKAKKLSPQIQSSSEGSVALTSMQKSFLQKYLSSKRKSHESWSFDGPLVDVLRLLWREEPRVLKALDASIKDKRCTKDFYDVDVTFDQFDHFTEEEVENQLWNVNVRVGCAMVSKMMNLEKCNPVKVGNTEDLREVFTNLKASAGITGLGERKQNSLDECFNTAQRIKKLINDGVPKDQTLIPAMVFHRAQISGFSDGEQYNPEDLKRKDRLVWGIDGASLAIEAGFAKPLIEQASSKWFGYAGGKDPSTLRNNVNMAWSSKGYWTSIDYSKFDQTIPSWLIHWCFSHLRKYCGSNQGEIWDWIEYNFINTKIAIPGRGVKQKHRGIPSGSNFTQLVGSMANAVMMLSYIASKCPKLEFQEKMDYVQRMITTPRDRTRYLIFVMGDDDLVFTSEAIDLQDLSEYVQAVFGVKINPDKCDRGSEYSYPQFLKREWRRNGEYQDPIYLVVNLSHPERMREYDTYSPWHIIYGMYLTYTFAFPNYISERFIVEQMEINGGVSALTDIPRRDLPGVLRAYGDDALRRLRRRAEHLLTKVS